MKFGHKLQTELPALYRNYAMNYTELKEQIFYKDEVTVVEAVSREVVSENLRFQELLERELLKVNRFARLEIESIDTLKKTSPETIARKLAELEKFVRLNKTGFRKISKKFDKLRKTNLQFWFMWRVEQSDFAKIDFHTRIANLVNQDRSQLSTLNVNGMPRSFRIPADEIFSVITSVATTSAPASIVRDSARVSTTLYDSHIAAEFQPNNHVLVTFANRQSILREIVDKDTFRTMNIGTALGSVSYSRTTVSLDSGSTLVFDEDFSFEPESAETFDYGILRVFGGSDDLIEDLLCHSGVSEVCEVIETLIVCLKTPKKPRQASSDIREVPPIGAEKDDLRCYRQALVRVEPKTFFANERVLLDWVHVSLVFAGVAAMKGRRHGAWLAAGAMVAVLLALFNFLARKRLLLDKATSGYFSVAEPLMLGAGVAVIVVEALFN